jgi:hypothetical protein
MISMREVLCPYCKAAPGERCTKPGAPGGYLRWPLPQGSYHKERLQELNRYHQIEDILRHDGLKPDEIKRVVVCIVDGVSPGYEDGDCRHCEGRGRVFVPGCISGTLEECTYCFGNGKTTRIKAPIERCVCGHTKEDHEHVPTGKFASMRLPDCCKHCWNTVGCPVFTPKRDV